MKEDLHVRVVEGDPHRDGRHLGGGRLHRPDPHLSHASLLILIVVDMVVKPTF